MVIKQEIDAYIIALDEYGEVHTWGRNDTGQCGISLIGVVVLQMIHLQIFYFSAVEV